MFLRLPRPFLVPILFGAYTLEFGVISLLPIAADRLNLSTSIGGFNMAVFVLLVALAGPILTLLASKLDRMKFIAAAAFVLAGTNMMSAFATNLGSLMTARLMTALLHPILFPMIFAIAMSCHPDRKKSLVIVLGIAGTGSGLALSVPLTAYVEHNFAYSSSLITFAVLDLLTGLTLLTSWRQRAR